MLIRLFCFVISCSLANSDLSGQSDSLVLETMMDIPFIHDLSTLSEFGEIDYNYFQPEKILWPNTGGVPYYAEFEPDLAWSYWLHKNALSPGTKLYKNHDLKEKIADQEWIYASRDTVGNCFGHLDDWDYKIVVNELGPTDFKGLRTKIFLYWNEQVQNFKLKLPAYALLENIYNNNGIAEGMQVSAWLPLNEASKDTDTILEDSDISFSTITIIRTFPKIDSLPFRDGFTKKLIAHTLNEAPDNTIMGYGTENVYLNSQEREGLISNRVDTIITAVQIVVSKTEFDWSAISDIQLTIRWYWDEHKQQLYYSLLNWAPLITMYDENGNALYDAPLFYRIAD